MLYSLLFLAVMAVTNAEQCADNVALHSPLVEFPPCFNISQQQMIFNSTAMPPSIGLTVAKIPYNVFMDFFLQTNYWPLWNPFVTDVKVASPVLCQSFPTVVTNSPYMPNFPKTAIGYAPIIVQNTRNATAAALGWSYLTIDSTDNAVLIFGRHDYYIQDDGKGGIIFNSWEKATGTQVYANSNAWIAGLQEAMLDGLVGVSCLEMVYAAYQKFDPAQVNASCSYLQLARPTLTTVPVPQGFVDQLTPQTTVCPPVEGSSGPNTPAILAGIFGSLSGVLVGAAAMFYYTKHNGKHWDPEQKTYVHMK